MYSTGDGLENSSKVETCLKPEGKVEGYIGQGIHIIDYQEYIKYSVKTKCNC